MRSLIYRGYRMLSGLRYWLRRRFTKAGLAVLGSVVAAGAAGVDIEQTVAYQAVVLLLGFLIVAVAASYFFKGRFAAERFLPRFGTVGNAVSYRVQIRNLTGRRQAGLVVMEGLADPRPSRAEFIAEQMAEEKRFRSFRVRGDLRRRSRDLARVKEQTLPVVQPLGTAEVKLDLIPLRRGVVRFESVTVARPDPLGLYKACAKVALPQALLILPKRYWLPPVALPGTMKYQQGGIALAASVGESEEFVSLREYRPGDPLRHIHWRSWAKAGVPIVKEFEDEFFVRHALVLDTFTDLGESELFEEAVSVAASFAYAVQTQDSLLDLLFVGPKAYCFTAGRGVAHVEQMLEILASVRVCRDDGFSALARLVLDHVPVVSGCICVFLCWDDRRKRLAQQLKATGVPLRVVVLVEPGQGERLDPGPLRDEPQRFKTLELGKIAEGLACL